MRLRISALVFAFLFSPVLGIPPAHASDPNDNSVTVSGTIWIDENVDGIRQPNEPVAPHVVIGVYTSSWDVNRYSGFSFPTYADENGNYTTGEGPRAWRTLEVHYLKPGAEPIFYDGSLLVPHYTHIGCATFFVPQDNAKPKLTLDIRIVPAKYMEYQSSRPLADGYFFSRPLIDGYFVRGGGDGGCDMGFAVTNADGIPFWDTWQEYGLENIGYPISHRYVWRGFVTQAFQKAIMQWQPDKGMFFVNIFDELHDFGWDNRLRVYWATPYQLDATFDAGALIENWENLSDEVRWKLVAERRLALLDANPALKERYYSAPDPLLLYGLPTSRVEDMGDHYAIRTQRTVLQQWKEDVPWAKAGEVTIANGGSLAVGYGWHNCQQYAMHNECAHLMVPGRGVDVKLAFEEFRRQHVDLLD